MGRIARRFNNRSRSIDLKISQNVTNRRTRLIQTMRISRVVMFLVTRHLSQYNMRNFSITFLNRMGNGVHRCNFTNTN